jgi:oligogalacturonide transport system permease protein
MLLPASVLIIPRYLVFARLNWVDTYLPFWIPAAMATSSFFIYMFIQFFRGLPRELDEAAMIDGCSSFGILRHILFPLCTPAIISAAFSPSFGPGTILWPNSSTFPLCPSIPPRSDCA